MLEHTADLFWSKVNRSQACWTWEGARTHHGYGRFGNTEYAHRFSYELHRGPIPAKSHIDHLCHNPSCVNPEHLRLTTAKQNGEHRKGPNKNSTTGVRGVIWIEGRQKFRAGIMHNRKFRTAGYFDTLAEAEVAVIAKRKELFTHSDLDRAVI